MARDGDRVAPSFPEWGCWQEPQQLPAVVTARDTRIYPPMAAHVLAMTKGCPEPFVLREKVHLKNDAFHYARYFDNVPL